jgi:hypothetical protein
MRAASTGRKLILAGRLRSAAPGAWTIRCPPPARCLGDGEATQVEINQFDSLVRNFVDSPSRRSIIHLLAGILAGVAGGLPAVDAEAACRGYERRCGGRAGRCCRGLSCCAGRCRDTFYNDEFCGDCETACATDAGEYCEVDTCVCDFGLVRCAGQCCGPDQACLGQPATCGSCPAGANACDASPTKCASFDYGDGEEEACYCVTSVDGVATCSSLWGFCGDCESDEQCSFAIGTQAVCIPAADCCDRFGTGRACVVASCFDGGPISPDATRGAERGRRLRPHGEPRS